MAIDLDRLRERAETAPDSVDPEAPARALESAPNEALEVGEALVALGESGSGADAVTAVTALLDDDDADVRAGAALALAVYVENRPDAGGSETDDILEALCLRLEDDYPVARKHAGTALLAIVREQPAAAVAVVDHVPGLLDPEQPSLLDRGLGLAEAAVAADSDAVADLLDPLLGALLGMPETPAEGDPVPGPDGGAVPRAVRDDRERSAKAALHRRNRLAGIVRDLLVARPDLAGPALERLLGALERAESGSVRVPLVEALGRVAEARPEAVAPAAPAVAATLADLLDDDLAVAGNAAWALGMLAETHPRPVADAAAEHADGLAALLEDGDPGVRTASATLTAYVGEYHPDAVATATDALVERLDDENANVRASAALALGYSGAEDAREPLRERADRDPDEAVRATARTAVERLADRDSGS